MWYAALISGYHEADNIYASHSKMVGEREKNKVTH